MYDVKDLKQVFIGRRGETNARVVEIDVTAMLDEAPDAAYSILMQRSGDDVPVLCETALDGSVLGWMITGACTAYAGLHPFEVRAVENGRIVKSRRGWAMVAPALADYAGEEAPSEVQTWIDALQTALAAMGEPSTADDLEYILGV